MTSTATPRPFTDGINIGVLTRIFDRDLVDDVLRDTKTTGQRTRLLPGRVVVYFVLAMCLFCDDTYEEVLRKLVNGLRFLSLWRGDWQVPTSPAITAARTRLGAAPLAELFHRVAVPVAHPATAGSWFRGLQVLAVDGVVLDTADTPGNLAEFGKFDRAGRNPFPQIRLVGLGECGTHAIVGARFDSCKVNERTLLRQLFTDFAPGSIVLADRGFYSYELWRDAAATGAHLLWRLKTDLKIPVLETLPDGSWRSELLARTTKNKIQRGYTITVDDADRLPVRIIDYTVDNRDGNVDTIRVMTTLTDHTTAPAHELAALYQQRWEFELTLDEVETHQMHHTRLLRSRTPELVRQEIWALLLTHYAVRVFMHDAADDIGDDTDHLSFIRSLRVIRRQVTNQAGFPLTD